MYNLVYGLIFWAWYSVHFNLKISFIFIRSPFLTCGAAHSRQAWHWFSESWEIHIFFNFKYSIMWYVCVCVNIYIYTVYNQPASYIFVFRKRVNLRIKALKCNLSGSCQLGCFLGTMVAQWPQTAAPVWDSRIGLLQVMKALWTTLDTWHVGLNFFYKKGMRNFKLKAPKKRLIDCVYGHSMKNSVYFRNTSFKKNGKARQIFRNFLKKGAWINLARKTTTSKWRSHVHPEHQLTMWTTKQTQRSTDFWGLRTRLEHLETVETQQTADGYSNCFQVEKILKQNAALHSVLELIFVVN